MRAWLLGAAVAGLQLLAAIAEEDEDLADVRASFLSAAGVWGATGVAQVLRPLSLAEPGPDLR